MDPNATLDRIRAMVQAALNADSSTARETFAQDIAEAIDDLDGWMSRGGAMPTAWKINRKGYPEHNAAVDAKRGGAR